MSRRDLVAAAVAPLVVPALLIAEQIAGDSFLQSNPQTFLTITLPLFTLASYAACWLCALPVWIVFRFTGRRENAPVLILSTTLFASGVALAAGLASLPFDKSVETWINTALFASLLAGVAALAFSISFSLLAGLSWRVPRRSAGRLARRVAR